MAFMIVNGTTGAPIPLPTISSFLDVQALILTMETGAEDVRTPFALRACNETDVSELLFEPSDDDWTTAKLQESASSMYCLDDPNAVELRGQFAAGDGSFLMVEFSSCGS